MAMAGVREARRVEGARFVKRRPLTKVAQLMGVVFNSETPTLTILQRMNSGYMDCCDPIEGEIPDLSECGEPWFVNDTPTGIPKDWADCKCGAMRFYPSGRCMQFCEEKPESLRDILFGEKA